MAKRYTSHINTAQDAPLTFNGQTSVTMAAGEVITSDPVSITYSFGQTLAISVYLPGRFGPVARHSSIFVSNYFTNNGAGDRTKEPLGKSFTHTTTDWLLINGIDVYGPYQGTLALFGSSTTDGFHSNYSDTEVYPGPETRRSPTSSTIASPTGWRSGSTRRAIGSASSISGFPATP